jgi:hypothetical protein
MESKPQLLRNTPGKLVTNNYITVTVTKQIISINDETHSLKEKPVSKKEPGR